MSRSMPYRLECPEKCLQTQDDALNSTFFILRQTGPTAFVIKEDDERIFKVFLGDQHQCSCNAFQRDRELCKHLCWLLLKRFRVPRTNPMLWQKGLVEREINELLRGLAHEDERNKTNHNNNKKNDAGNDGEDDVEQRSIGENDVCPICQEEFLIKKLPITYCRHGCGNNVHVKCMKVWLDHQVSTGEKTVKCPLCRETFGTPEQLKQEFRTSGAQQAEKASIHLSYSCNRCHACPITGKCYKCTTCHDYFLCQTCFNLNIHNEHQFDYREKSFQRWKLAIREHLTALPNALHQMLGNREITENDYDILLQLENAQTTAIMGIPENIVKSMPTERVHERSRLLQHGEQCRICLRSYQVGERVRRLRCRHKFHIDYGWLLHSHPTCPIDGQLVWSAEMDSEQREAKRSALAANRHSTKHSSTSGSSLLSVDMGLSVTPYHIRPLHIQTNTDLNQRFRRLHMRAPLRPLIAATTNEFSPALEINAHSIGNRQLSSNDNERRQSSLLSPPLLEREEIRRVNLELNQHFTLPPTIVGRRLLERRRSNAK
ncbi:unnamed protein product [Rotaria magnacalcarata]|uniref:E3 ubiquitin-protein ligase ZSWIM2 n=1 Tax=Rotaria magnacalcarata TaxID=392030 RepID=A0A818Z944_9BILA|nr:unnamed protein product [Rotaria magnacalcarata]CAF1468067.1 unnamed protein product [Rotaria magnacalcarata]CAF1929619.1 unnamed protein product [Rotaria magnacalcarata]CAF2079581.1 unnamed protein product [Rotaria magnacalcarata]CAF3749498.1 unnamed protein product [Rotaria magnacalcarata]